MTKHHEKKRSAAMGKCLIEIEKGNSTLKEIARENLEVYAELKPLIETANAIYKIENVEPRSEFKKNARIRLMNAIVSQKDRDNSTVVKNRTGKIIWPKFATALAIFFVVALLSVQTTTASARALPGDTLYSVKIAYEGTHLALSSELEDAKLHLKFAQTRLVEIEVLAGRGDYDRLPLALIQFQKHILQAQQNILRTSVNDQESFQTLSQQLTDTVNKHKEMLFFIQHTIPAAEREMISDAIEYTDKIPLFTIPINPKTGFLR